MNLKEAIGIGVAGNFAGHLEQAGEAKDFTAIKEQTGAPKGIFPFYIPGGGEHQLNIYPYCNHKISYLTDEACLQIEPEVVLICDLIYQDNRVTEIIPKKFGAFNDCSIRGPGSEKLSGRKNWGAHTKGISEHLETVNHFGPGGILDHYRLTSYLLRNGQLNAYGQDSKVTEYMYFYKQLIDWLVIKLNQQEDSGPLEEMSHWMEKASYPQQMILSVGATKYTPFGATNYLRPRDVSYVVLYDERLYDLERIENIILKDRYEGSGLILLRQEVVL